MARRPEHQPIQPGTAGSWREYDLSCALIDNFLPLGALPQSLTAILEAILQERPGLSGYGGSYAAISQSARLHVAQPGQGSHGR
jgi:hypothetical protein